MATTFLRRVGAVLTALVLGLLLLSPSANAAPPGGGGGEPGPSPVNMTLDGFTLSRDGSVLFTGTVTCDVAADVHIGMNAQQGPERRYVSVLGSAKVGCEAGTANPIEILFDPEPGRFRRGTLTVGIELDAVTRPDEHGNSTQITQFGIVDWELGRPTRG